MNFLDRSIEQISVSHVKTDYLFGEPVGEGLHTQEEQMVGDLKTGRTSTVPRGVIHFFSYISRISLCNRLIKIKEWVDKNDPGAVLIPFSGVFENKIFDMDEAERAKYFEEHKVTRLVSLSPRLPRSVITIINILPTKYCCVALANKGVRYPASFTAALKLREIR